MAIVKLTFWVRALALAGIPLMLIGTEGLTKEGPDASRMEMESMDPSASKYLEASCGDAMVFDRNSGRMIRRNRVDLVVVQVEARRDGSNLSVRPTIRNRCPDSTSRSFILAIGEVTTTITPLAGESSYTLGHWIVIGDATSFDVTVDDDHQINEVNERNNTCRVSFPEGIGSTIYNCR